MFNYKATIQYDGTNYFGWQSQPSGNTIQDEITRAVNILAGEKINLIGSGRTDSGVHALGQTANFTLLNELDLHKFKHSINSILPDTIVFNSIEAVPYNFHSRFDAKLRSYIYLISIEKSPFYKGYSYFYPQGKSIELDKMNLLSKKLLGKNDFTSFCKAKTDTENKICEIHEIHWKKNKGLIIFKIEADRFLHGMVRTIVGTLLKAYNNLDGENYIINILKNRNRESAANAVPAEGLFLFKVKY